LPEAIATRAGLFAIPFALWFLWWAWSKYTRRPMGSTPWPWLFAAGAVLVGISLMAGVLLHRDNRGQVYVPAEATPSGKVVPGHFEERAPKRP
jgi:heme A synthase